MRVFFILLLIAGALAPWAEPQVHVDSITHNKVGQSVAHEGSAINFVLADSQHHKGDDTHKAAGHGTHCFFTCTAMIDGEPGGGVYLASLGGFLVVAQVGPDGSDVGPPRRPPKHKIA